MAILSPAQNCNKDQQVESHGVSSSSSKTINLHPSVDGPLAVPCRQRGLASPTIHHSEHTRSTLKLSENLSSASFHDSLHTFPESSQECCPQEQQNQSRCFLMFPCWILLLLAWPHPWRTASRFDFAKSCH